MDTPVGSGVQHAPLTTCACDLDEYTHQTTHACDCHDSRLAPMWLSEMTTESRYTSAIMSTATMAMWLAFHTVQCATRVQPVTGNKNKPICGIIDTTTVFSEMHGTQWAAWSHCCSFKVVAVVVP